MTDIIEMPPVPTPYSTANNLENVYDMVKEYLPEELRRPVMNVLATSARNIKAMFELQAGDDGKIRPRNMGQLLLLADTMITAGLAPSSYENNPPKVVIGLLKAMEIGVEPVSGLGNIMIVNNRPSVWGDLAQALVERTGTLEKQIKRETGTAPIPGLELAKWDDAYGWEVSTYRNGQTEPYVGTYTVADAKRAGLWMNTKKKPWISDPARMLFNRARAFSLRDGFSDCLFGMGIIEEQRDIASETLLAPRTPLLTKPDHDDEPVTSSDLAQKIPDYGDDTAIPTGEGEGQPDPETTQPANEEQPAADPAQDTTTTTEEEK